MLSSELIATPEQVRGSIALAGTNIIDFQGNEGDSASQTKCCVLFLIFSSINNKCCMTVSPFSKRE